MPSTPSSNLELDHFRGCLLGLAAGDAVGTTVEFQERGSFPPVTDMVGGGPFSLKAGFWSDDTSMALCLATSLIKKGGFDPKDQMDRYCRWWRDGYLSSTGDCFDIGNTVRSALQRYTETGDPFSGSTHSGASGNGSLMRLAPVPLFYYPDREQVISYSAESSRTTHASAECLDACRVFGDMLRRSLSGAGKEDILSGTPVGGVKCPSIQSIVRGEYQSKKRSQIRSTGYVVHSLEAALWCFWKTKGFEEAVLEAANLGDDADTVAAICGQVAGAHYGASGIPQKWLERLAMRAEITLLSDQLHAASVRRL